MIDWTKPIEYVTTRGVVHPAIMIEKDDDSSMPYRIEVDQRPFFCEVDGRAPGAGHARNVQHPMPEPTATWWARRWYDSASPDEREAMRVILAGEG